MNNPFNIQVSREDLDRIIDTVDAMIILNRDVLQGTPQRDRSRPEMERDLDALETLSVSLKEQKEQQL